MNPCVDVNRKQRVNTCRIGFRTNIVKQTRRDAPHARTRLWSYPVLSLNILSIVLIILLLKSTLIQRMNMWFMNQALWLNNDRPFSGLQFQLIDPETQLLPSVVQTNHSRTRSHQYSSTRAQGPVYKENLRISSIRTRFKPTPSQRRRECSSSPIRYWK